MSIVTSGIIWNSIQQFGSLGVNLIAVVVLSRLLSPSDYGIYGILMIFISLADVIIDSGMGGAVIKNQKASNTDFSTLLIYNMVIGVIIYLIYFICAPFVASFYNNNELIFAIRLLGLAIILFSFANMQNTKLLKELKYKTLAIISIVSGLISLFIAIVMALNNMGFWSLIFQQLVYQFCSSLLMICYTKYIPILKFDKNSFKEQFHFGVHLVASSVMLSISSNISNNIIGKTFSLSLTGLYSQANKLSSYPVSISSNIIDRTFFPIFSQINDSKETLYNEVKSIREYLYAAFYPFFGCLICFANEIIPLVLGSKWLDAIPFFQYLIIGAFPLLGKAMNRSVLKSTGETGDILKTEVFSMIVLFASLSIALYFKSIMLIVCATIFSSFAAFIISSIYVSIKNDWSLMVQFKDFVLYIPTVILPCLVIFSIGHDLINKILLFILSMGICIITYEKMGINTYSVLLKKFLKR